MQVTQLMASYNQPNFVDFKYDEKRYLSQFISEKFDSTKYAPQYDLNSSVTMATYWVPELLHITSFSCHFWRSILIFAHSTSYA